MVSAKKRKARNRKYYLNKPVDTSSDTEEAQEDKMSVLLQKKRTASHVEYHANPTIKKAAARETRI